MLAVALGQHEQHVLIEAHALALGAPGQIGMQPARQAHQEATGIGAIVLGCPMAALLPLRAGCAPRAKCGNLPLTIKGEPRQCRHSQTPGHIIRMPRRSDTPCFHTLYAGHEALIDIRTLEAIGGSLPKRAPTIAVSSVVDRAGRAGKPK